MKIDGATDPSLTQIACKRSIWIVIDGTLVIKLCDAEPGFYLDVFTRYRLRGVGFRPLTLTHAWFNQCITNYSLDTVIRSFLWAASYWMGARPACLFAICFILFTFSISLPPLYTIQLQLRVPLLAIRQKSLNYRTEHVLIEFPIKWCQATMSLESSSVCVVVGGYECARRRDRIYELRRGNCISGPYTSHLQRDLGCIFIGDS